MDLPKRKKPRLRPQESDQYQTQHTQQTQGLQLQRSALHGSALQTSHRPETLHRSESLVSEDVILVYISSLKSSNQALVAKCVKARKNNCNLFLYAIRTIAEFVATNSKTNDGSVTQTRLHNVRAIDFMHDLFTNNTVVRRATFQSLGDDAYEVIPPGLMDWYMLYLTRLINQCDMTTTQDKSTFAVLTECLQAYTSQVRDHYTGCKQPVNDIHWRWPELDYDFLLQYFTEQRVWSCCEQNLETETTVETIFSTTWPGQRQIGQVCVQNTGGTTTDLSYLGPDLLPCVAADGSRTPETLQVLRQRECSGKQRMNAKPPLSYSSILTELEDCYRQEVENTKMTADEIQQFRKLNKLTDFQKWMQQQHKECISVQPTQEAKNVNQFGSDVLLTDCFAHRPFTQDCVLGVCSDDADDADEQLGHKTTNEEHGACFAGMNVLATAVEKLPGFAHRLVHDVLGKTWANMLTTKSGEKDKEPAQENYTKTLRSDYCHFPFYAIHSGRLNQEVFTQSVQANCRHIAKNKTTVPASVYVNPDEWPARVIMDARAYTTVAEMKAAIKHLVWCLLSVQKAMKYVATELERHKLLINKGHNALQDDIAAWFIDFAGEAKNDHTQEKEIAWTTHLVQVFAHLLPKNATKSQVLAWVHKYNTYLSDVDAAVHKFGLSSHTSEWYSKQMTAKWNRLTHKAKTTFTQRGRVAKEKALNDKQLNNKCQFYENYSKLILLLNEALSFLDNKPRQEWSDQPVLSKLLQFFDATGNVKLIATENTWRSMDTTQTPEYLLTPEQVDPSVYHVHHNLAKTTKGAVDGVYVYDEDKKKFENLKINNFKVAVFKVQSSEEVFVLPANDPGTRNWHKFLVEGLSFFDDDVPRQMHQTVTSHIKSMRGERGRKQKQSHFDTATKVLQTVLHHLSHDKTIWQDGSHFLVTPPPSVTTDCEISHQENSHQETIFGSSRDASESPAVFIKSDDVLVKKANRDDWPLQELTMKQLLSTDPKATSGVEQQKPFDVGFCFEELRTELPDHVLNSVSPAELYRHWSALNGLYLRNMRDPSIPDVFFMDVKSFQQDWATLLQLTGYVTKPDTASTQHFERNERNDRSEQNTAHSFVLLDVVCKTETDMYKLQSFAMKEKWYAWSVDKKSTVMKVEIPVVTDDSTSTQTLDLNLNLNPNLNLNLNTNSKTTLETDAAEIERLLKSATKSCAQFHSQPQPQTTHTQAQKSRVSPVTWTPQVEQALPVVAAHVNRLCTKCNVEVKSVCATKPLRESKETLKFNFKTSFFAWVVTTALTTPGSRPLTHAQGRCPLECPETQQLCPLQLPVVEVDEHTGYVLKVHLRCSAWRKYIFDVVAFLQRLFARDENLVQRIDCKLTQQKRDRQSAWSTNTGAYASQAKPSGELLYDANPVESKRRVKTNNAKPPEQLDFERVFADLGGTPLNFAAETLEMFGWDRHRPWTADMDTYKCLVTSSKKGDAHRCGVVHVPVLNLHTQQDSATMFSPTKPSLSLSLSLSHGAVGGSFTDLNSNPFASNLNLNFGAGSFKDTPKKRQSKTRTPQNVHSMCTDSLKPAATPQAAPNQGSAHKRTSASKSASKNKIKSKSKTSKQDKANENSRANAAYELPVPFTFGGLHGRADAALYSVNMFTVSSCFLHSNNAADVIKLYLYWLLGIGDELLRYVNATRALDGRHVNLVFRVDETNLNTEQNRLNNAEERTYAVNSLACPPALLRLHMQPRSPNTHCVYLTGTTEAQVQGQQLSTPPAVCADKYKYARSSGMLMRIFTKNQAQAHLPESPPAQLGYSEALQQNKLFDRTLNNDDDVFTEQLQLSRVLPTPRRANSGLSNADSMCPCDGGAVDDETTDADSLEHVSSLAAVGLSQKLPQKLPQNAVPQTTKTAARLSMPLHVTVGAPPVTINALPFSDPAGHGRSSASATTPSADRVVDTSRHHLCATPYDGRSLMQGQGQGQPHLQLQLQTQPQPQPQAHKVHLDVGKTCLSAWPRSNFKITYFVSQAAENNLRVLPFCCDDFALVKSLLDGKVAYNVWTPDMNVCHFPSALDKAASSIRVLVFENKRQSAFAKHHSCGTNVNNLCMEVYRATIRWRQLRQQAQQAQSTYSVAPSHPHAGDKLTETELEATMQGVRQVLLCFNDITTAVLLLSSQLNAESLFVATKELLLPTKTVLLEACLRPTENLLHTWQLFYEVQAKKRLLTNISAACGRFRTQMQNLKDVFYTDKAIRLLVAKQLKVKTERANAAVGDNSRRTNHRKPQGIDNYAHAEGRAAVSDTSDYLMQELEALTNFLQSKELYPVQHHLSEYYARLSVGSPAFLVPRDHVVVGVVLKTLTRLAEILIASCICESELVIQDYTRVDVNNDDMMAVDKKIQTMYQEFETQLSHIAKTRNLHAVAKCPAIDGCRLFYDCLTCFRTLLDSQQEGLLVALRNGNPKKGGLVKHVYSSAATYLPFDQEVMQFKNPYKLMNTDCLQDVTPQNEGNYVKLSKKKVDQLNWFTEHYLNMGNHLNILSRKNSLIQTDVLNKLLILKFSPDKLLKTKGVTAPSRVVSCPSRLYAEELRSHNMQVWYKHGKEVMGSVDVIRPSTSVYTAVQTMSLNNLKVKQPLTIPGISLFDSESLVEYNDSKLVKDGNDCVLLTQNYVQVDLLSNKSTTEAFTPEAGGGVHFQADDKVELVLFTTTKNTRNNIVNAAFTVLDDTTHYPFPNEKAPKGYVVLNDLEKCTSVDIYVKHAIDT